MLSLKFKENKIISFLYKMCVNIRQGANQVITIFYPMFGVTTQSCRLNLKELNFGLQFRQILRNSLFLSYIC